MDQRGTESREVEEICIMKNSIACTFRQSSSYLTGSTLRLHKVKLSP
jgi:hypothetical protein